MSVNERLKLLIKALGLNVTTFSREIGLNNNVTILRIVKDGFSPSYKTTYMIKSRYPNLSLDWFIFNEGSMWIDKYTWDDEKEESPETKKLENIIKKQLNSMEEEE